MFLRQKLQNEDSSFKILPQKRISMGKLLTVSTFDGYDIAVLSMLVFWRPIGDVGD